MRLPTPALVASTWLASTLGAAGVSRAEAPAGVEPKETVVQTVVSHRLDVRLKAAPEVIYDPARLGRIVLPAQITITNRSAAPVPLEPKGLRFTAKGALARYACEAQAERERWPESLAPGEQLTSDRVLLCETTLPGRHDLELRWADDTDGEPAIATTSFTLAGGSRGPVRLASRPELFATASGSREARPSHEPGKVRIVIGVVNAGPTITTLSALDVVITLRQRGRTFACEDRRTLDLRGMLGAGRIHVVWLPLGCAVPYEGEWEATVEVGEPRTPKVRLQPHVVHVREVPPIMQVTTPR